MGELECPAMDNPPPPPHSSIRAKIILAVISVVIFSGLAMLLVKTDPAREARGVVGWPWVVNTPAGPRFVLLTAKDIFSFGRGPTGRKRRYELQTHDARTGERGQRVTLAEGTNATADVIGVTGRLVWIWRGEIEARDGNSLEVVVTEAQLRTANPDLRFGDARDFYAIGPDAADTPATQPAQFSTAGLLARSLDGRFHYIDPDTLRATELTACPVVDIYGRSIKLPDWFKNEQSWPTGHARRVSTGHGGWGDGLNGAVIDGRLLLIATEDERANLSKWFSRPTGVYGQVRRRLYGGEVRLDGKDYAVDGAALGRIGEAEYLVGGFLPDPAEPYSTWVLDGTLLLGSRTELGDNGRTALMRIRPDGSAMWTAKVGIFEVDSYVDAGPTLLFTGVGDARVPTSLRPYLAVLVDKATAMVTTYSLGEDRVFR